MANLALTLPLFCLFLIYSNSNGIVTLGQAAGQQATWCIAKPGAPIAKLQANINYVCNVLMNCCIIRPGGACFKPNEVPNHASVLMNLYYQKAGRNLWNCNFNNTGVTTMTDPSGIVKMTTGQEAEQLMGPSMLPTFHLTGNLVLAERLSPRFGKISAGDIVVVRSPEHPRKSLTKRVRAMEGEKVTYLVDPQNSDKQDTIVVPKGHVWIEGDNTYNSHDSKNFGPIPYGLIEGRIFFRVWPFTSFGSVQ